LKPGACKQWVNCILNVYSRTWVCARAYCANNATKSSCVACTWGGYPCSKLARPDSVLDVSNGHELPCQLHCASVEKL
jgi:hypothetical protein